MNSERYTELSEDIIEKFQEIYNTKSFPIKIGFTYLNDDKLKKVVEIKKLSEMYQVLLNKEMVAVFNETLFDKLDEESIKILIEQELDKVEINMNNGKIKMNKPNIQTFSSLLNKYGKEKIVRANDLDNLSAAQEADMVA